MDKAKIHVPNDGPREVLKANKQNIIFGESINSQARDKSADTERNKRPTSKNKKDRAGQKKDISTSNGNETKSKHVKATQVSSTNSKPLAKVNKTNPKTTVQSSSVHKGSPINGGSLSSGAGHVSSVCGRGVHTCTTTTVHTTVQKQSISNGTPSRSKTPKKTTILKKLVGKRSPVSTKRQDTEKDVNDVFSSGKPDSSSKYTGGGGVVAGDDGDIQIDKLSNSQQSNSGDIGTQSTRLTPSPSVNKSASFSGSSSGSWRDKLYRYSSEPGGGSIQRYEKELDNFRPECVTVQADKIQSNFRQNSGTMYPNLTQASFGQGSSPRPNDLKQASFEQESGTRPDDQTQTRFGQELEFKPKYPTQTRPIDLAQASFGPESGARPKELTQASNTLAEAPDQDYILPNIEVRTSTESIVNVNVDVIVSSEDSTLHSGGLVAKAIAKSGGDLLDVSKDLIRKICPNIQQWTFQPTPAYDKLICKHIFNAVIPQYTAVSQHKWKDGFRFLVTDLFNRTEQFGYESIALPLIGTGRNGAPIDFVIDLLCQLIDEFAAKDRSNPCLQSVFILHPDKKVKSKIDDRIKSLKNCSSTRKQNNHKKSEHKTDFKAFFLKVKDRERDTCPICMEEMSCSKLKQLSKCKHIFCKHCLEECFKRASVCPVCNMVYGVMIGSQPDGLMVEVFRREIHLPGYDNFGTIQLYYSFLGGIQTKKHPNPGSMYKGTKRTAYLPDNPEGQRVHRLLRQAFQQRLVFTIGSSRTTGQEDVVTWNDIHHKTKIQGGPERYGYPDADYLSRVLDELAAKGIAED